MTLLHLLQCDRCDTTTPAFDDEGAMWRAVRDAYETAVAS